MRFGKTEIESILKVNSESLKPDVLNQNIMLNAFRIAINGSLTQFNMIDGIVDEYEDESGVDVGASTNEIYDSGNDFYSPSGSQVQIGDGVGSIIGDLQGQGGLDAIFDGATTGTNATGGQTLSLVTEAFAGKDWGVGITKTITGFKVYSSSNIGFVNTTNPTVTATLYGSNSAPSNPTDGTALGNISDTDAANLVLTKLSGLTISTAYRYHWIRISDPDTQVINVMEIQFFDNPSTNMTLLSNAFTADAQPDSARIVLFEEDVDSVTLNTDLKAYASRDGGITYTQITLVDEGDYQTGKQILTGLVDISGQPAGTSMKYKIETLNEKNLKVHGCGISWD